MCIETVLISRHLCIVISRHLCVETNGISRHVLFIVFGLEGERGGGKGRSSL